MENIYPWDLLINISGRAEVVEGAVTAVAGALAAVEGAVTAVELALDVRADDVVLADFSNPDEGLDATVASFGVALAVAVAKVTVADLFLSCSSLVFKLGAQLDQTFCLSLGLVTAELD